MIIPKCFSTRFTSILLLYFCVQSLAVGLPPICNGRVPTFWRRLRGRRNLYKVPSWTSTSGSSLCSVEKLPYWNQGQWEWPNQACECSYDQTGASTLHCNKNPTYMKQAYNDFPTYYRPNNQKFASYDEIGEYCGANCHCPQLSPEDVLVETTRVHEIEKEKSRRKFWTSIARKNELFWNSEDWFYLSHIAEEMKRRGKWDMDYALGYPNTPAVYSDNCIGLTCPDRCHSRSECIHSTQILISSVVLLHFLMVIFASQNRGARILFLLYKNGCNSTESRIISVVAMPRICEKELV